MTRPFLTPRKQQVYQFILNYKKTHDGNSPSIAEIGAHCEVNSTSTIRFYLKGLETLGVIKCDPNGKSRMISIVGGKYTPPALPKVVKV